MLLFLASVTLASSVYICTNQRYHVYRWVLLEVLDKVSPGAVNWKQATKPPIKMPFRKVENCNQVVKLGMQLKLSLVNVAGNDIVQGNRKLILGKSQDSSCLFYALNKLVKVMQVLCKVNQLHQSICSISLSPKPYNCLYINHLQDLK